MEFEENRPPIENSLYKYRYPFPDGTVVSAVIEDPPEGTHRGRFNGALDFIVPLGTMVLSPGDGWVIEVIDKFDKGGPDPKFQRKLNLITVSKGDELFQIAHLAKGSAQVKVGDFVWQGKDLAKSGVSGQMSEPHIHFFVFKPLPEEQGGFVGVKPRFVST